MSFLISSNSFLAVLYPARVIPYGMHGMGMDSMEWGMDSILFQDGFHGMGDGFHAFLRWNGGWISDFFYLFHKSKLISIWDEFI